MNCKSSGFYLVLFCTWGCAAENTGGSGVSVRDSAGVTIIESAAPADSIATFVVSGEATISIGTVDGPSEFAFQGVVGAVRLSDGRIVIADGGSQEVRYFSADGTHLRTVGGRGDGPGEFQRIRNLIRLTNDSVLAIDPSTGRFTVLDPSGNVASIQSTQAPSTLFGRLLDGSAVYTMYAEAEATVVTTGAIRPEIAVIRAAPQGSSIDTLARLPGEAELRMADQGRVYTFPGPFGGTPVMILSGNALYIVDGNGQDIVILDPEVGSTRVVRTSAPKRRITADEIAAYTNDILDRYATQSAARRLHEIALREATYPEAMPIYVNVHVDPNGLMWADLYKLPGEATTERRVFRPTGEWMADVSLPAHVSILEIGQDYLLALWTDDLGVEYVRTYELSRKSG